MKEINNEKKYIVVLVTDQTQCENLIYTGYMIAQSTGDKLAVLSVQPPAKMQEKCTELDYLFKISMRVGAEMSVYYDLDCFKTISAQINRMSVSQIIAGLPNPTESVLDELIKAYPKLLFTVVSGRTVVTDKTTATPNTETASGLMTLVS